MGRDNFELFVMVKPVYGYDVRGSETKKRIKELNSKGQQKYGGQQ